MREQLSHPMNCHIENIITDPLHPMWNDSSNGASGIFDLPFSVDEASVIIVPVPWDAACSQGRGTANAPQLILDCSRYVELHDLVLGNIYERGIAMTAPNEQLKSLISQVQKQQNQHADEWELPVDTVCQQLNQLVMGEIRHHLQKNRATGLLGGDHSVSFGSIAAHLDAFPDMGILQIDAHADLRPSLDGMTWSHASVMRHVMETLHPPCLTQVGIRGICSVERAYHASNDRITMFTDHDIQMKLAEGQTWMSICDAIINSLPNEVYLTLDIDGLDPSYCPHTGTPVPGGMTFVQVLLLLHRIIASGRTIRGFDLVEVGGHAQDALIAAHLLYPLCGLVEKRG
ncbi:MAG: arginase family protein [Granulosicoccus sp.]